MYLSADRYRYMREEKLRKKIYWRKLQI